MKYSVKEVPLTGAIMLQDGRLFGIGNIDFKAGNADYLIYDPEKGMIDDIIEPSTFGRYLYGYVKEEPRAISDKGGLFAGDYVEADKNTQSGYKILEFDPVSLKLRNTIELSEFIGEEWDSKYKVADIVRVNDDSVLIACYKSDGSLFEETMIEIFIYFQDRDELYNVGRYVLERSKDSFANLEGAQFDSTGEKLTCRIIDDDDDDDDDEYSLEYDRLLEIMFFDDWHRCEIKVTDNTEEAPEFLKFIERSIDIDEQEPRLFSKGYFKVKDLNSDTFIVDEVLGRGMTAVMEILPRMDLFVVQINSDKYNRILVFEYVKGWNELGDWEINSDELCECKCFTEHNTVLIESNSGALMMTR